MTNPDFIALAKAMRVHAIRVTSAEELPAKMVWAVSPAHSSPSGFLHRFRMTMEISDSWDDNYRERRTQNIYQKIILGFVDISTKT